MAIFPALFGPVENQHACGIACRRGLLRDQILRQIVIEIGSFIYRAVTYRGTATRAIRLIRRPVRAIRSRALRDAQGAISNAADGSPTPGSRPRYSD